MSQLLFLTQQPRHETDTRVRRPGVLILCIAFLGLAACDQANKTPTVQAPAEVPAADSAVVEAKRQTQADADEAALAQEPAGASERILNLAYTPSPEDDVVPGDQQQLVDEKNMLPDMFDQQKKARTISVSGGLLTDPEKDEYLDSVNGAEVSLKVRTR